VRANHCSAARIELHHRTKSLRYVLLTMEFRMSWDVRLSMEVHIDGRCDGAVDVGYRCQSGADSADHRGSDYRQSLLEWRARLRPAGKPKRLSRGVGGPVPVNSAARGYSGHVVTTGLVSSLAPSGAEAPRRVHGVVDVNPGITVGGRLPGGTRFGIGTICSSPLCGFDSWARLMASVPR
jgi:hypothetical protein